MLKNDEQEIQEFINGYFELGKTKELEKLNQFLAPEFNKFGDSPPFERRDAERALMLEQIYFVSISDFEYSVTDLKVELTGDVAVAAFILQISGIVVDDYSFRGATINNRSRVTAVLRREKASGWRMVHQHVSRFST